LRSGRCRVGAVGPASVGSGSASVERAEPTRPGQFTKEEQLVDLADRPADLVDRDAAHEGGQRGRLVGGQAAADEQAIGRPRHELGGLVRDARLCCGRRAGDRRGTGSDRGRRREEPRRRGVARRSTASSRASLCRSVHLSQVPSTLVCPTGEVRCGMGMLVSDREGRDDPSVPCHLVLPANGRPPLNRPRTSRR
jgi:hypothetical protein